MSPASETKLQRATAAYIITGLLFMLLPGTFLGVWNLIAISNRHSLASLSASWLQAHGHAQIFGWVGTFVIGIGYYSLSKMGRLAPFAVGRAWLSWVLWTSGLILRWTANAYQWQWRVSLPASALLELAAFLIFFATVSWHERSAPARGVDVWMKVVIASTIGFLLLLLVNLGAAGCLALRGAGPDFPHWFDQRYLMLATWGFPVLAIWGFNGRWLPVFLGLPQPSSRGLSAAVAFCGSGVLAALAGWFWLASGLLLCASGAAVFALKVFESPRQPAKTQGVHRSFPFFVRLCYVWLLAASLLSVCASGFDFGGGIWGASRHALTVGFVAGMIFAIGQRVLPAFCGLKVLFSPRMMLAASLTLNVGCLLRVASEIPAYDYNQPLAWHVLPCSAILELLAVSLFAVNLALTLASAPPHLRHLQPAAA